MNPTAQPPVSTPATGAPRMARALRLLGRAAALAVTVGVLVGVFTLYLRPDFMVTVANEIWACF